LLTIQSIIKKVVLGFTSQNHFVYSLRRQATAAFFAKNKKNCKNT